MSNNIKLEREEKEEAISNLETTLESDIQKLNERINTSELTSNDKQKLLNKVVQVEKKVLYYKERVKELENEKEKLIKKQKPYDKEALLSVKNKLLLQKEYLKVEKIKNKLDFKINVLSQNDKEEIKKLKNKKERHNNKALESYLNYKKAILDKNNMTENLFKTIVYKGSFNQFQNSYNKDNLNNEKNTDVILKVEDFNLYYGTTHALHDINMEILKRKVTAFIGPSGCGKSTLLRSFNRMNELYPNVKTHGKIFYYDTNIFKINPILLRTRVGMVFQQPNPFSMSIFDNVAYGLRCNGIKNKQKLNEIVITSLQKAGLYEEVKDRLKDNALMLSGGQQQRLCIARCIAMSPDVILMDEPTSALDPKSTQKIEELILELKSDFTIVIVTHNMQQAARISDKTAFFYIGDLIEYDETIKLFENPSRKETEDYIGGRFG